MHRSHRERPHRVRMCWSIKSGKHNRAILFQINLFSKNSCIIDNFVVPLQRMNKRAPEILCLRKDIEREVKRKIRTPYDFEFLVGVIWERMHENISPTTLKRLWGYIDGAETTRRSTLCLLSRFLGYEDWEAYMTALAIRTDVESVDFQGEGLHSTDLKVGDLVEVTWLPNRRCVFRYEGDVHYVVVEARNSKLRANDRFETACFIIGKPLYVDRLIRGNEPPTSYAAGTKNGLVSVRKI